MFSSNINDCDASKFLDLNIIPDQESEKKQRSVDDENISSLVLPEIKRISSQLENINKLLSKLSERVSNLEPKLEIQKDDPLKNTQETNNISQTNSEEAYHEGISISSLVSKIIFTSQFLRSQKQFNVASNIIDEALKSAPLNKLNIDEKDKDLISKLYLEKVRVLGTTNVDELLICCDSGFLHAQNDQMRFIFCYQKAYAFFFKQKYKDALEVALKALTFSISDNDKLKVLVVIIKAESILKNFDNAKYFIKQAQTLNITESLKNLKKGLSQLILFYNSLAPEDKRIDVLEKNPQDKTISSEIKRPSSPDDERDPKKQKTINLSKS